ncbi:MAG: hypothetical protein HZC41_11545 [Chloroflexi bacterium]|nr:hypothetical protein [Chloroflexota bacterium]
MLRMYIEWDNPTRTTIYVEAAERPDGLDGYEAARQIGEMVASVEHPVNLIVCLDKKRYVRPNYFEYFAGVMDTLPARIGCIAFVTTDPFFKDLFTTAVKVTGQMRLSYFFVSSLEQARRRLEMMSASGQYTFGSN